MSAEHASAESVVAAASDPTADPRADPASLAVTVIGGPTALLEWAGLRILLDPTFDPPTVYGPGENDLTKTEGPALAPADLGRVDLALVSHHHHEDIIIFSASSRAVPKGILIKSSSSETAGVFKYFSFK